MPLARGRYIFTLCNDVDAGTEQHQHHCRNCGCNAIFHHSRIIKLLCHQSTIGKVMTSSTEACSIRCKEENQLCHFLWSSCLSSHIKRVFANPIVFYCFTLNLRKFVEEVINEWSAYSACTDGIDADAMFPEIDGQRSGDLSECTLCQSITKTIWLAYKPLVRAVDYH